MKSRKMVGRFWLPHLKITQRASGSYCIDSLENHIKKHGAEGVGFPAGDKRKLAVFHVKHLGHVSRETLRRAQMLDRGRICWFAPLLFPECLLQIKVKYQRCGRDVGLLLGYDIEGAVRAVSNEARCVIQSRLSCMTGLQE